MIEPDFRGDLREVPVSVLAYIGDAVYELTVRLHLCKKSYAKSGALHRKTIELVNATAQADAARRLLPLLTEEEASIFRRGRNSQPGSMPKHADPAEYLVATGFEAVIGYLYLKGDTSRLDSLLAIILEENNNG
jgi:ribonuclease-3 family protein